MSARESGLSTALRLGRCSTQRFGPYPLRADHWFRSHGFDRSSAHGSERSSGQLLVPSSGPPLDRWSRLSHRPCSVHGWMLYLGLPDQRSQSQRPVKSTGRQFDQSTCWRSVQSQAPRFGRSSMRGHQPCSTHELRPKSERGFDLWSAQQPDRYSARQSGRYPWREHQQYRSPRSGWWSAHGSDRSIGRRSGRNSKQRFGLWSGP